MSDEPRQPMGFHAQAEQDIKQIGDILRNKCNMQPAAAPELDKDGVMRVQYVPPPSYADLKLSDLGKPTIIGM